MATNFIARTTLEGLTAQLTAADMVTDYVFEHQGNVRPIPVFFLPTATALANSYAEWQGFQDEGPLPSFLIKLADLPATKRQTISGYLRPGTQMEQLNETDPASNLKDFWYTMLSYENGAGCPEVK